MESPRERLSRITKETRRELEERERKKNATLASSRGGGRAQLLGIGHGLLIIKKERSCKTINKGTREALDVHALSIPRN